MFLNDFGMLNPNLLFTKPCQKEHKLAAKHIVHCIGDIFAVSEGMSFWEEFFHSKHIEDFVSWINYCTVEYYLAWSPPFNTIRCVFLTRYLWNVRNKWESCVHEQTKCLESKGWELRLHQDQMCWRKNHNIRAKAWFSCAVCISCVKPQLDWALLLPNLCGTMSFIEVSIIKLHFSGHWH